LFSAGYRSVVSTSEAASRGSMAGGAHAARGLVVTLNLRGRGLAPSPQDGPWWIAYGILHCHGDRKPPYPAFPSPHGEGWGAARSTAGQGDDGIPYATSALQKKHAEEGIGHVPARYSLTPGGLVKPDRSFSAAGALHRNLAGQIRSQSEVAVREAAAAVRIP
jgi:hypothetical protein